MGLLDTLEHGLERAVRSAFSAGGSRAVKPVEIASALRHAMDDESVTLSEGHTVAPNDFTVRFSPADFERARTWGQTLAGELCDEVIRHARSQGYVLPGAVRVAFHSDDAVRPGRVEVVSRLDDGSGDTAPRAARPPRRAAPGAPVPAPSVPSAPAARPAPERTPARAAEPRPAARRVPRPPRAAAPVAPSPAPAADEQATVVMPRGAVPAPPVPALEFGGDLHPLEGADLVLGRSPERADVVVPDSSVSRQHLRLVRGGGTVTLVDLGSRNGVTVNGRRVDGSTVLRQGDRITVGQTDLVFHVAVDPQRRGA